MVKDRPPIMTGGPTNLVDFDQVASKRWFVYLTRIYLHFGIAFTGCYCYSGCLVNVQQELRCAFHCFIVRNCRSQYHGWMRVIQLWLYQPPRLKPPGFAALNLKTATDITTRAIHSCSNDMYISLCADKIYHIKLVEHELYSKIQYSIFPLQ